MSSCWCQRRAMRREVVLFDLAGTLHDCGARAGADPAVAVAGDGAGREAGR